jgi:hypothetical protein
MLWNRDSKKVRFFDNKTLQDCNSSVKEITPKNDELNQDEEFFEGDENSHPPRSVYLN